MSSTPKSGIVNIGPRVWLAAFGKHPGWDDHIEDLGLETERLVWLKRRLYTEGIGGLVDAGAWEGEADGLLEGFSHSFVLRASDGIVVGRIWSSSDGKGRSKYPMIVCAQTKGLSFSFCAGTVMDRLRKLEEACREDKTAAGVVGALEWVRADLRTLGDSAPEASREPLEPPAAISVLADEPVMGPDRHGLLRVLYRMERDFGLLLRQEGTTVSGGGTRIGSERGHHLRLPAIDAERSTGDAWSVWLRFFSGRLRAGVPVMLFAGDGRDWTDAVIGEPTADALRCLRVGPSAIPLATTTPFTIDAEFVSGVDEAINAGRSGTVSDTDPGWVSSMGFDRLKRALGGGEAGAERAQAPLWPWVVAVLVLVAVVLGFGALLGGGDG